MASVSLARFDADRVSRLAILFSASCAVAWEAFFGGWSYWGRGLAEPLALFAALTTSLLNPVAGRAIVLFAACTLPAVLNALTGLFDYRVSGVWIAALLGVVIAETRLRRWSLPGAWRLSLALGGLCVAVTWPIVAAREADFSIPLLFSRRPAATDWVVHVASVQLIGILWVDTLFGTFVRQSVQRFERQVLWPFGAGALASVAIGLYQTSVDPAVFNPTIYGVTGRAAGLMQDGNVFGILSAMWIAALAALALRAGRLAGWTAMVAASAAFVAVWGSGSRTALLAACCAMITAGYGVWKTLPSARARIAAAASGALLVTAVIIFIAFNSGTSGPVGRIQLALDRSWAADQSLIQYLWERGGHGLAALQMIQEHPWVGVGVGAFHTLVSQFSRELGPAMAVGPDNAQNWFRHQLAELGILGGLGWFVFATILTVMLVRSWQGADHVRALVVAGAIVGLGLASLVGVPTQHVVVLITFWTFVFWHDSLRRPGLRAETWRPNRWHWTAVAVVAGVFGAATVHVTQTELGVPHRALRFGQPYERGFHPLVDQSPQPFRRTGRQSLAVFRAEDRYLKLTFWAEHPDVTVRPVRVQIWRRAERIANVSLSTPSHVTWYVRAPDTDWMMLATEVGHTWSQDMREDNRREDDRRAEVGLTLAEWEFVHDAPRGVVVVD